MSDTSDATCMLTDHPVARHHSDDTTRVFHGGEEPAVGCGYHALYFTSELIAAHKAQMEARA